MSEISFGNLYEMNKKLSEHDTLLDPIILNKKLKEVANSLKNYDYLLLLCHDKRDYTVFNLKKMTEINNFIDDLRETLQNRGRIVSIDKDNINENTWEIWIRDHEDYCYYLFDYTNAVIEVK